LVMWRAQVPNTHQLHRRRSWGPGAYAHRVHFSAPEIATK
jgi:hypothetical protein